jgi:hypothetical protein
VLLPAGPARANGAPAAEPLAPLPSSPWTEPLGPLVAAPAFHLDVGPDGDASRQPCSTTVRTSLERIGRRTAPWQIGTRPVDRVLTGGCVGIVALQLLDVHSTSQALGDGLREGNPVMRGVASKPVPFTMVKLATAGLTIVVSHNYRADRR